MASIDKAATDNPATGKRWTSRELKNAVLAGSMTLREASRNPSLPQDYVLRWTAEERSRIPEQAVTFEDFKWDTMQDLRAGITAGTITPMEAYRLSGRYDFVTEAASPSADLLTANEKAAIASGKYKANQDGSITDASGNVLNEVNGQMTIVSQAKTGQQLIDASKNTTTAGATAGVEFDVSTTYVDPNTGLPTHTNPNSLASISAQQMLEI